MHILIYADVMERYRFFSRMVPLLKGMGYAPKIMTAKLSIALQAEKAGYDILHLKKTEKSSLKTAAIDLNLCLSVLNKYHTPEEANSIASSIQEKLEEFHQNTSIDMFFIWNGTTTIARSITHFAKKHRIQTRYFEISNLGNRVFVDIEGTNAASYLYQHPEILDNRPVSESKFQSWLTGYHASDSRPKQAANRSKLPWHVIFDHLGYRMGYLQEDRRNIFILAYKRLLNRWKPVPGELLDLTQTQGYTFLPLQVSDDSQLLLYSDLDNEALIKHARQIGKDRNLNLIVKLHPAEHDLDLIERITRAAKDEKFLLSANPSDELIRHAELVIVNNSTVGLQAMIEQKEVIVTGQAFYHSFDHERLKSYILEYLLEADYFGSDPIPPETVEAIISRDTWSAADGR